MHVLVHETIVPKLIRAHSASSLVVLESDGDAAQLHFLRWTAGAALHSSQEVTGARPSTTFQLLGWVQWEGLQFLQRPPEAGSRTELPLTPIILSCPGLQQKSTVLASTAEFTPTTTMYASLGAYKINYYHRHRYNDDYWSPGWAWTCATSTRVLPPAGPGSEFVHALSLLEENHPETPPNLRTREDPVQFCPELCRSVACYSRF